jgi:putative solute:sodium symporter small subunit
MALNDPRTAGPGVGDDARRTYWRRTLRLTGALLALWFIVTFGVAFFARDLDFDFFGWPFSFWVAGQGALLVYLAIVGFYAWAMRRLDASSAAGEDD